MRNAGNQIYHSILGSRRWRNFRRWYLSSHPLCEECEASGITRAAQEVHHIVPVETAKTREGMERLAFNFRNLKALCHDCHERVHEQRRAHGAREANRQNKAEAASTFMQRWTGQEGRPGAIFDFSK